MWNEVLSRLSGAGMAAALDLPGHPSGEITCTTVQQYAEAVHGFISESSSPRQVVAGHSMGGAVALELAISRPEDVRALILLDTGAKLGVLPDTIKGLEGPVLKTIENVITPMSYYDLDAATARSARASLSLSNPGVFLNDYLACKSFDRRVEVSRITVPALIICGDRDRMTPPKWSHFLSKSMIGSSLFFIADCGHMSPLEKPDSVARLIQSFLQSVSQ